MSGEAYENLPDTYVIFICDFDPFGDGLYRYTTNTVCRETGNSINDGIVTIYLNAHGKNSTDIPDELLQFLDYVKNIGRKENTTEGKQKVLLDSLESKFAVSPELKEIICAETNPAKLKSWCELYPHMTEVTCFQTL